MPREQFWFFHPFRVRYSEIDGQGVVFNAHYLTYFDTTITEYFRALGYDQYADAKQSGVDFHVVKSVIEYKAPVRFDWELDNVVRSPQAHSQAGPIAIAWTKWCPRRVPPRSNRPETPETS